MVTAPLCVFAGIARKGVSITSTVFFGLLFPALVLFGGSLDLINWGPGLLFAGLACLLLLDEDRHSARGGMLYSVAFLSLLGLLLLRARLSPGVSATANHTALIALVATGFLIGRLAGPAKARALFIGLALVALVNLFGTVMHRFDPEWNLIYPERTGQLPSGLFPHYSYSAAFCLGAAGLLAFRMMNEQGWIRAVMIGGAFCALLTIPLSPSRGGNLALALMTAGALALLLARAYLKSKPLLGIWLPALLTICLALIFTASFVPLIDRDTGHFGFYHDGVRLGYWSAAWQISSQHPWLGGGAGSYAWNVYQVLEGLTSDPVMVHNEALQLAAEYGWPALVAMSALLLVPVIQSLRRFIDRSDATCAGLAALGLMAMLFQSNFESIFHHAPGAFVAALLIGQISRSLWWTGNAAREGRHEKPGDGQLSRRFLEEIRAHVETHAAGGGHALGELVRLLSQSEHPQWRRGAYRLSYWSKVGDSESLGKAVVNLGVQASEELEQLAGAGRMQSGRPETTDLARGWPLVQSLAVVGIAMPTAFAGLELSRALAGVWEPLYHPERMTISDRFERLLRVVERHPGLGMDRDVLSAGWDSLHQYRSQEAREYWATIYRRRILNAIPSWRTDPGAALQIAEITGWAGDYRSALKFYNHAIATQGKNETLFMASSYKGQYFHELFISADTDGQIDQKEYFARSAVEAFHNAAKAMGGRRLPRAFDYMLRQCQKFLAPNT